MVFENIQKELSELVGLVRQIRKVICISFSARMVQLLTWWCFWR